MGEGSQELRDAKPPGLGSIVDWLGAVYAEGRAQ